MAMNTNARLSVEQALGSRAGRRCVAAVSPSSTRNSTWAGSVDAGVGQGRAEVLARRCRATNGTWSAAGLSSASPITASPTTGRSAVSATAEHDGGQDQREHQELEQARRARRPPPPPPSARPRWTGSENSGIALGRVGVGVVRVGLRGTAIPGASAGADRHRLISWGSGVRGKDERMPARVSSSSWRMMAAASRSTRAR